MRKKMNALRWVLTKA